MTAKPIYVRSGAMALAAASLALLAACGGGGGGGVSVGELADGWRPPLETVADQDERALAILPEVDSEFISSTYSEHSDAGRRAVRHRCAGTRTGCAGSDLAEDPDAAPVTRVPADGQLAVTGTRTPFLLRNGVTLVGTVSSGSRVSPEDRAVSFETRTTHLGAWMDHSRFGSRQISAESFSPSYYGDRINYGYAYGDLTRSAPAASATWRGVMVGGQASGGGVGLDGHMLVGNAELVFDMESATLDARFSGIVNADRRDEPHSVTGVSFSGVPVDGTGIFRQGGDDSRIQGGFYGPDHAETVGVFEKAGIVASFGAKRE